MSNYDRKEEIVFNKKIACTAIGTAILLFNSIIIGATITPEAHIEKTYTSTITDETFKNWYLVEYHLKNGVRGLCISDGTSNVLNMEESFRIVSIGDNMIPMEENVYHIEKIERYLKDFGLEKESYTFDDIRIILSTIYKTYEFHNDKVQTLTINHQ